MKFKCLSLGCKVNEYEIDAVEQLLIKNGFEKGENPDVFIINTCSVTSVADQKDRQAIRRIRKIYPNLKCLFVMGCYSQHAYDFVSNELGADVVIGTKYRNEVVELINMFINKHEKIVKIDNDTRHFNYENFGVIPLINKTRAYVKIQDGCNNFCSYCLIAYMRGNCRSRNKEDIIYEIKSLVERGFKEVVLTGIHTAGYGLDLENYSFSDLVEDIVTNVPELYRLRISSIEISEIDEKFISLLKKYPQIANHLHIPIQSGCSSVLKRMNRKYDEEGFIDKINVIRSVRNDIAITTDVIVGFPGETDEEFLETYNFINKVNFAELHVFPFSARENTAAAKMKDQVLPTIKKERSAKLLKLSDELFETYKMKYNGKEVEVLIEDYNENEGLWNGHTSNYLPVKVFSKENLHGKIVKTIFKI